MTHIEEAREQVAGGKWKVGGPVARPGRLAFPQPGVWLAALIVIVLLLAWELAARAGRISVLFFPAPTTIASTLVNLTLAGKIWPELRITLMRLTAGLFVGGGAGLLLGLSMGWSTRLRSVLDPLVAAVHPIPKISVLPLIMIIFGIGEESKIVLVAIGTFFPMLISTMAGVRQIHPIHFEVAQNYGAGPLRVFTRVVLPGSLPMILAGLRLALNMALVLTIAVELLTARQGLGAVIWLAWETLRTEQLYAALVVTALLGIAFNLLIHTASRLLMPWQIERASDR